MSATITREFIANLREPGTSHFSMPKVVQWLELPSQTVAAAAGVHRNTLAYSPESPRVQDFARNLVRVATALRALNPDAEDNELVFLLKNYPLADLGAKTALQLVEAGRTDDVVGYLDSFRAGFVG
jgi:hypothetical protein